MARLPHASRQDLLDELHDIRAERDAIVGEVAPWRADQLRACLDWWERDLTEQLAEMDALSEPGGKDSPLIGPGPSEGGSDDSANEKRPSAAGSLSDSRSAVDPSGSAATR